MGVGTGTINGLSTLNPAEFVKLAGDEEVTGVKTFTNGIKTNLVSAKDNNTLEIVGKSVALAVEPPDSTSINTKLIVHSGDSTKPPAAFPFENNKMDLGTTDNKFKDLHLSGNINDVPSTELQRKSNLLRIQVAENTFQDLSDDTYTDIFAYQGGVLFKAGFTGKQIKTFYIEEGFKLKNDTNGPVPKINVDFAEQSLGGEGWTADSKMYLVGYTTDACPLFRRGIHIPTPSVEAANKVIKVDSTGKYTLEQGVVKNGDKTDTDNVAVVSGTDGKLWVDMSALSDALVALGFTKTN